MEEGFRLWANPSSPHAEGRQARAALEDARMRMKRSIGWSGELIFTSGASEAAALALSRAKAGTKLVSAVEHDCILQAVPGATRIPVLSDGQVDLDALRQAIDGPGALVAVQDVNSETGNRQIVETIAGEVGRAGGVLLTDFAQSAGKRNLAATDMGIVSAHKFGGPIGVGALLVRDFAMLEPSGGHERGYRRGTENLPAVLGMVAALEAAGDGYFNDEAMNALQALAPECRSRGGTWLSDRLCDPVHYIQAIAMPGISASAQVMRFDMAGISVSQGSACSSGTMKTSAVLQAMNVEPEIAANTIRVSLGWNTTREEVERFCEVWIDMAKSA